jgi:hypothetical protein
MNSVDMATHLRTVTLKTIHHLIVTCSLHDITDILLISNNHSLNSLKFIKTQNICFVFQWIDVLNVLDTALTENNVEHRILSHGVKFQVIPTSLLFLNINYIKDVQSKPVLTKIIL